MAKKNSIVEKSKEPIKFVWVNYDEFNDVSQYPILEPKKRMGKGKSIADKTQEFETLFKTKFGENPSLMEIFVKNQLMNYRFNLFRQRIHLCRNFASFKEVGKLFKIEDNRDYYDAKQKLTYFDGEKHEICFLHDLYPYSSEPMPSDLSECISIIKKETLEKEKALEQLHELEERLKLQENPAPIVPDSEKLDEIKFQARKEQTEKVFNSLAENLRKLGESVQIIMNDPKIKRDSIIKMISENVNTLIDNFNNLASEFNTNEDQSSEITEDPINENEAENEEIENEQ